MLRLPHTLLHWIGVPLTLLSTLWISPVQPARAAFLIVNETCTLPDAITAANTDQPSGGCPAGSVGADTIVLSADVTLTAMDNTGAHGPNGLPVISSAIILRGNGYSVERSAEPGTPDFRLFEIAPGGRLQLENVTLRGGSLVGSTGGRGTNASRSGTNGEKGDYKLVAFFYVGEGNPGEDGGPGNPGDAGDSGQPVEGGAIYNQGELLVANSTVTDHRVIGGTGGPGGAGSNGGTGGEGGTVGIIAPIVVVIPPGRGGNGGAGGSGGAGGAGGAARGAAIYNAGGIVTIADSTIAGNVAQGGSGGRGGRGGHAGAAGDAGIDGKEFGPGGTGGRGGSGGAGGSGGDGQGGAIYNAGGLVTITSSTLERNTARGGPAGAGGRAGNGSDGGTEAGDGGLGGPGGYGGAGGSGAGGGIYHADGTLTVERSSLLNLTASGGAGGAGAGAGSAGDGGDLFIAWGTLSSEATTAKLVFAFAGADYAGYDTGGPGGFGGFGGAGGHAAGGSVFVAEGRVSIDGCILAGNNADGGSGGAGGEGTLGGYNSDILADLYQWLIDQGWSEFRGINPGENGSSGVAGAAGPSQGGAVHSAGELLLVDSSTLTGNTADQGGALWSGALTSSRVDAATNQTGGQEEPPARPTVINSTIAGNTATRGGGLFAAGTEQDGALAVGNTIVAGNDAPTDPDLAGTILSLDYNLVGSSGSAIILGERDHLLTSIDPQLGEPEKNGGLTTTLALQASSPAINSGRCARTTDQRGFYRVDGRCDIGAFEYGALAVLPPPVPNPPANSYAGDSIRAGLPAGTYLRVIAADGVFVRNPGEIGVQSVLDQGVISAVDVFVLGNVTAAGASVCLHGEGTLIFLAATNMPRTATWLAAVPFAEGYACTVLPGDGTLVLVPGGD